MKNVNVLFRAVLGGLFMLPLLVWSQCPNLNFSHGNMNYWQCYKGECAGGNYWVMPTAPTPGRVEVMNAAVLQQQNQLYDEYCPAIKKVPDGFAYSCKIGNSNAGAEVDAVEYTMKVDSANSLLLLSFAWVMQYNAEHSPDEQSQFSIKIRDSVGKLLNFPCGNINFSAGSANFLLCDGGVRAQDWTTFGLNVSQFMGKTIKIYFETSDCAKGGDFGYAYVVAECRPSEIELAYCAGSTAARMTAPDGFLQYEWSRSSNPSWREFTMRINVSAPIDGEIFTVKTTSELGCSDTLNVEIVKTNIDASFMFGVKDANGHVNFHAHGNNNWYDTATRTATFVDLSKVNNGEKKSILWQIPELNILSRDSMWTYTFPDPPFPIAYLVRLTVFASNGCADTSNPINHYITIVPSPKVRIDGAGELCKGDSIFLKPVAVYSKFVQHTWSWVLSTSGVAGSLIADSLKVTEYGVYCLKSLDTNGYYAYDTFVVTSLRPTIENLRITNIKCNGDVTGQIQHGNISGLNNAGFIVATWTVWDNVLEDYKDVDILPLLGSNASIQFGNQIAGNCYFYGEDAAGCEYHAIVNVSEPVLLSLSAAVKDASCTEDNGQITFYVTGGTPFNRTPMSKIPYDISIIKPDGTNTTFNNTGIHRMDTAIFDLAAGVYTVTVTDANNCTATEAITVSSPTDIPLVSMYLQDVFLSGFNQPVYLTPVYSPANACKDIVWHSNDANVVTVNAQGLLRSISYGETYVVLSSEKWGVKDSCKVTVGGLGITPIAKEGKNIRVYPNPTTGQLTIENGELTIDNIEIYDIYGRKAPLNPPKGGKLPSFGGAGGGAITIDISHLANGMYYLKISGKENRTVKIVKN